MEVDHYMCVKTLGGTYNTRWPINEIHHASDIVSAASIVSHYHSSFSRAITISYFPSSGGKEGEWIFWQEKSLLE